MSTYTQGRNQEYLKALNAQIQTFVSNYNSNPTTDRTTIFLFPGGQGSELVRATQPSNHGPPFSYTTVWLDWLALAFGAVTDLQMHGDEDYLKHYVLPQGCIDTICLTPYDGFIQWCGGAWIDLFVFGWDWRRSTFETADFFLNTFFPQFTAAVAGCNPNPLNNFWLIGHSFGGMVVKQILNQSQNPVVQNMTGAITVATPFYGYGGQVHRYFLGDSQVNWTLDPDGARKVTRINSTLAAGYELLFLDGGTYDANQTAFANDPDGYNLTAYPSMDPNSGQRADPYNPVPGKPTRGGGDVRYISTYAFDWKLLGKGDIRSRQISQALDQSVSKKFWNIRGVQTTPNGTPIDNTVVCQDWVLVLPTFDPQSGADGITDYFGPGDDVLPAWSTRLLGNANPPVTIADDQVDHMEMLNLGAVQTAIANLLRPSPQALERMLAKARTRKMKAASRDDLNALIAQLSKAVSEAGESKEARLITVRNVLREVGKGDPDRLRELFARGYLDALKTPSQIRGSSDKRHRRGETNKPAPRTKPGRK